MNKLSLIGLFALVFVYIEPLSAKPFYSFFECSKGLSPICADEWLELDKQGHYAKVQGASRGVDSGARDKRTGHVEWSCDFQRKHGAFCCVGHLHLANTQADNSNTP
ncbi:hypothetical protein DFH28DRAFT_927925 [Melampsora americana]|nr:hypothetical protein DFH28DRAFT_927925 [Melampsora americana]